ncbi:MAG: cation-translocating P-type ATPase [Candidatus Levybacteria bacterium]|nr:cation-translocating P-type ATPase [Candidatus Levybacteria bacterium]
MLPHGLSSAEAQKRLEEYGLNRLPIQKKRSTIHVFLAQFISFINGLLCLAALFSFVFSDLIDGFFILATIFLNGVFSFIQEFKAEKTLEKLLDVSPQQVRVLRDEKESIIPAPELVPGDIVILLEGDKIPADGVCIQTTNLELNESTFTGESLPVEKSNKDQCFMGTLVTKGKGLLLIQKTGGQTRFGQLATTLSTLSSEKTPLAKQLSSLGKVLTLLAIGVGIIVTLEGLFYRQPLTSVVLSGVSIAVAAVPEGLPLVLTVALALGTSRLAKKGALIRKMDAVETLGAIQVLLVDKTGTLTQNTMRVKKIWSKNNEDLQQIHLAARLSNTASLIEKRGGSYEIVGDKTDGALLEWSKQQNSHVDTLLKSGVVLDEFVFDTKTKTVTTVWSQKNNVHVFVRGAPEEVLTLCKTDSKTLQSLETEFQSFAKDGLRVIAFAHKTTNSIKKTTRKDHESNLTFLGFVGIYDPPRKEVKEVLLKAKHAGIRTIMVTGDNELTARHIADEVGLLENDATIMTGEAFFALSQEEARKRIKTIQVIARAQPEHKLKLAEMFQKDGFIVGVTGDGVNDSLVLKKAHVGIAMGESGTDVAKEASDIIITDDNFSTIIRAIEEGRAIYHNILKAILYLLTSNISELTLVVVAAMLNLPAVLLPTQILWINLVTDGLPALALATDSTSHEILKDPPRDTSTPLITRKRLAFILTGGIGLGILLLLLYKIQLASLNPTVARTIIFNLLIFSHLIMMFVIRGRRSHIPPRMFIVTTLITIALQGVITFTPFFQNIFHIGI